MLDEEDMTALVDLLRRNLLYQTAELLIAPGEKDPHEVSIRFMPPDFYKILELIKKAGGWDLTEEQKIQLEQQQLRHLEASIEDGLIDLESIDVGSLLHIIEMSTRDPDGAEINKMARTELINRSGAN
jgi:hypothetical protein